MGNVPFTKENGGETIGGLQIKFKTCCFLFAHNLLHNQAHFLSFSLGSVDFIWMKQHTAALGWRKKNLLHECILTTWKQKPMQNSWALIGARSKLRSKVKFSDFVPISCLNNFVCQRQKIAKKVACGKQTIPNKINRKSLGPVGVIFSIIF